MRAYLVLNHLLMRNTKIIKKSSEHFQKYLDSESIYWKDGRPLLQDGQVDRELTETDLILIAAHTFYLFRTVPKDEHREEMLRPFVQILTTEDNKRNWLLDTNSLLLKSRNDFENYIRLTICFENMKVEIDRISGGELNLLKNVQNHHRSLFCIHRYCF